MTVWSDVPISIDPVITNKLFIGKQSLCRPIHRYSNHLTIPVQDSEYEDLLIHLPEACGSIQSALDQGGKVLVHCVMGVSRSATVVCAYLMSTQRLSAHAAIRYVRKRRPIIHPNYGFMKQLIAFGECRYKPSCTSGEYITWRRRQKREVTKYLNLIADTVPIIHDQLYLSSDFPGDPDAAESLLLDLGMTHVLSISSAQLPKPNLPLFNHCFIDIPNNAREALLLELPTACKFIGDAIASGGQVLVQCRVELRACIIVCAYLMFTRHIPPRQAFELIESALPLYDPTDNFFRHLELFAACNYVPTPTNPLVQAWISGGTQAGKPSPIKTQSATCTAHTSGGTLTLATTTMTFATEPKVFDFAALSEVLARLQSTSTTSFTIPPLSTIHFDNFGGTGAYACIVTSAVMAPNLEHAPSVDARKHPECDPGEHKSTYPRKLQPAAGLLSNGNVWDYLVVDEDVKNSINGLVDALIGLPMQAQSFHPGAILFQIATPHGPPGTGKMLTAEAVTEHIKKPLHIISCQNPLRRWNLSFQGDIHSLPLGMQ